MKASDDGGSELFDVFYEGYDQAFTLPDVEIPERISWSAEGRDLRLEVDQQVRFDPVFCRAFWVARSNLSLSYHLSFEIPCQHTAPHYFALSLPQKFFFPSEGAESMCEQGEFVPTAGSRITRTCRDLPLPG